MTTSEEEDYPEAVEALLDGYVAKARAEKIAASEVRANKVAAKTKMKAKAKTKEDKGEEEENYIVG